MSKFDMKKMVRRIGPWAGARWMRNRNVPFAVAHEVILGRPPRFA